MRLIDADELLQTVSIKSVFGNEINKMKCGELRTILEMIENAPTVEPQRMRGKWIDGLRMSFDGTFHWYRMCSECDYERDDDNIDMDTNFCPNCGADMRGEQNESN